MPITLADVLWIKFQDELKNGQIKLQDDGDGPYIKKWEAEAKQPTDKEIQDFMVDAVVQQQYVSNQNKALNTDLYNQLQDIDFKSIRALRINDTEKLAAFEQQAVEIRAQLLPVVCEDSSV